MKSILFFSTLMILAGVTYATHAYLRREQGKVVPKDKYEEVRDEIYNKRRPQKAASASTLRTIFLFLSTVGFVVLGYVYFKVLPLFWDFDPCFSTTFAQRDLILIRNQYESLRSLVQDQEYKQAYQLTASAYRNKNGFATFENDVRGRVGVPPMKPESTIFVCGNRATLSINGYSRSLIYFVTFKLIKQNGRWYFESMSAFYD
jgi:hypothetical protein